MQLGLVAIGYAGVLAFAAAALYGRHLMALMDPAAASGGMAAAGDTVLYLFIGCLFLIPTAFLIWIAAKIETWDTAYSCFLLGLSLTAPVCLSGLMAGESQLVQGLGWLFLFRMLASPLVFIGLGMSRLIARFERARKWSTYALLVEGVTLGAGIAALMRG
jgi:hypothetical protein